MQYCVIMTSDISKAEKITQPYARLRQLHHFLLCCSKRVKGSTVTVCRSSVHGIVARLRLWAHWSSYNKMYSKNSEIMIAYNLPIFDAWKWVKALSNTVKLGSNDPLWIENQGIETIFARLRHIFFIVHFNVKTSRFAQICKEMRQFWPLRTGYFDTRSWRIWCRTLFITLLWTPS